MLRMYLAVVAVSEGQSQDINLEPCHFHVASSLVRTTHQQYTRPRVGFWHEFFFFINSMHFITFIVVWHEYF